MIVSRMFIEEHHLLVLIRMLNISNIPVNMLLYHPTTCSFVTPSGAWLSSSITPSEFMIRYVAMGGMFWGTTKSIFEVTGLFFAPGKRGLSMSLPLASTNTHFRSAGH